MADEKGEWTQEEKDRVVRFLTEAKAEKPCPACGSQAWTVASHRVLIPAFVPAADLLPGYGYPGVLIVCNRCSYFRLHSATRMGLTSQEPKRGS